MDHSEAVLALFHYAEEQYPIACPDRKFLRIQSSRRWAVNELANRILDHPDRRPIDILTEFVGQLTCMLYNMQTRNQPKERCKLYFEAIGVLLNLEKYFDEV